VSAASELTVHRFGDDRRTRSRRRSPAPFSPACRSFTQTKGSSVFGVDPRRLLEAWRVAYTLVAVAGRVIVSDDFDSLPVIPARALMPVRRGPAEPRPGRSADRPLAALLPVDRGRRRQPGFPRQHRVRRCASPDLLARAPLPCPEDERL
jgi:hypothetical protein